MGSKGQIPEELSQTLLTNKKQGTWTKYTPLTLSRQCQLALTAIKKIFCLITSLEHLKNFLKMIPSPI
jgi:hypothetical protein